MLQSFIERLPVEKLIESRALVHLDSVYFFNHANFTVSTYTIFNEGFSYSVVKHTEEALLKQFNFVYLNKRGSNYLTKEFDEKEFHQFVQQMYVLQEQSHSIRPLVTFENYIEIIRQKLK